MVQSTLKTRVITGFVFGIVLIGGILWNVYTFLALLLIIVLVGNFEYHKLLSKLQIFPNTLFTYLGNLIIVSASFYFSLPNSSPDTNSNLILFVGISFLTLFILLLICELFRILPKPIENIGSTLFSWFYLGVPIGLLLLASIDTSANYQPVIVLFFFFFMWASDTAAYFSGRSFGQHKLFERHSPNKTVEGFIGGLLGAGLIGLPAHHFIGVFPLHIWICIGAVLSVSGTLGDLIESMIKRQTNNKDSGKLLPGHGGILDRFDSTFVSAPVYFFLLKFLS